MGGGGGETVTHASVMHGILGGSGGMPPQKILHSLRLILKPFWSKIYGPEKKLEVPLSLSHMSE